MILLPLYLTICLRTTAFVLVLSRLASLAHQDEGINQDHETRLISLTQEQTHHYDYVQYFFAWPEAKCIVLVHSISLYS